MKLFEQAASQGDAIAQYSLGRLHDGDSGAPVNFTKAREWYEKAASQGDAMAQHNLAIMHAKGEGGAGNENKKSTSQPMPATVYVPPGGGNITIW